MLTRLVRARVAYDKARREWLGVIQALEQAEARMWDAASEFSDAKAKERRRKEVVGRLRRST